MTASSAHSMKRLSPSHCNMPLAARRIFKYLALIHLLSILSVNGNDTTPPNCDSQTSRYDPLACWLWKGSIRIPNQSFIDGIIKIQIRDMICTHFQITSISSQYIASLPPVIDPSLQLSVGAVSATCAGTYHSMGLSGKITAVVISPHESAASMSLFLRSNSTRYHMATSVSTMECSTDLIVPADTLHFEGSISAKLIDLFKGNIAGYISATLSMKLCPLLTVELDTTLTRWILQADDIMMGWITNNKIDAIMEKKLAIMEDGILFQRDTPLLVTILTLANQLFDRYLNNGLFIELLQWLGMEGTINADCGYFFKGINGLVRSITNGRINVKLPRNSSISIVIPNYALLTINIKHVELEGLDSLDRIQLLQPNLGPSLKSLLQTQIGFNITMAVSVTVTSIENGAFQGDPLDESFYIYINSTDISGGATLTADLNRNFFDEIQVGHIISAVEGDGTILGCLLNPLKSIQLQSLTANLHISQISVFPDGQTTRSLEDGMDSMLNHILQLFLGEYPAFVTDALDGFVRGPGQVAINKVVMNWIETMQEKFHTSTCAPILASNVTEYLDFTKYNIFDEMNEFINRPKVVTSVNNYMDCLAEAFVTQVGSPQAKFADVTFRMREFMLKNVGSLESLKFLSPDQDGVRLQNNAALGPSTLVSSFDMSAPSLSGTAQLKLSKGETRASTVALILYDLNKVRTLSLASLMKCGYCITLPAAEFVLYNVAATMSSIQVVINATIQGLIDDVIEFEFDSVHYPTLPALVESLFSWGVSTLFDSINGLSTYLLSRSDSLCTGGDIGNAVTVEKSQLEHLFWLFMFFIFANIAFLFFRELTRNSQAQGRHNENQNDEVHNDDLRRPLLESRNRDVDEGNYNILINENDVATSLLESQRIPTIFRHSFPILIIGITVLLIASNLSVGASVDMAVSLGDGVQISTPSLFAFSLGHTIEEMYNAGIWPLLLLVLVYSGIWPYLKLALMLFAWVAPPNILSTNGRGGLLFSLDALGKFSLVDTFVLVLMMVSFRYHLDVGGLTLDVYVKPIFGFYGFLLATSLSMIAGHMGLFFHRKALFTHQSVSTEKEALINHGFAHGMARKRLSWLSRVLILIILVIVSVFLVLGAVQKSFVFEIGGLAGALLIDKKRHIYSMISLGAAIAESVVADPLTIGVKCLQGIYFFYTLVTPCVCLLALLVLLFLPMTLVHQRIIMAIAEVANAWSAIEVFALSIIVAQFEISTFANFIIGKKCDIINLLLQNDIRGLDGDDVCFSVDASVKPNVFFLVFGVLINSFVVSFLLRLAHVAVRERHNSEDRLGEIESLLQPLSAANESPPLVQRLMQSSLRGILFVDVTNEMD